MPQPSRSVNPALGKQPDGETRHQQTWQSRPGTMTGSGFHRSASPRWSLRPPTWSPGPGSRACLRLTRLTDIRDQGRSTGGHPHSGGSALPGPPPVRTKPPLPAPTVAMLRSPPAPAGTSGRWPAVSARSAGLGAYTTNALNGRDPFAEPPHRPAMACRLYRDDAGVSVVSPIGRLRQPLKQPPMPPPRDDGSIP
jgi:hypothetical protein